MVHKLLKYKLKLQRGDTIVEVMLAMAVIGMVLGVAYGIANRSVTIGRSAQERSEALKIAESQLELIKEYAAVKAEASGDAPADILADDLDISGAGGSIDGSCFVVNSGTGEVELVQVADSLDTAGDACERTGLYQIYVSCISGALPDKASPIAKSRTCSAASNAIRAERKIVVRVIWERLGASLDPSGEPQRDSVDLFYRYGG